MHENRRNQVALLLEVMPFVAEESCLALYGGTAINLFVREMPRLSVDIDLIYLPVDEAYDTALQDMHASLDQIRKRIERLITNVSVKLEK